MKSFLLNREGKPILKWGMIPPNIFYEGAVPENYFLAVCPGEYIVLDIDNKPDKENGLKNIPSELQVELFKVHFHYPSKSGYHVWLKYTGNKELLNRATSHSLDLRVGYKGYVKWYLDKDIRSCTHLIKESTPKLNEWLEKLFS